MYGSGIMRKKTASSPTSGQNKHELMHKKQTYRFLIIYLSSLIWYRMYTGSKMLTLPE